ncbi:hypothetical protein Tco_0532785 [Tanacetum coccineum]
MTNHAGNPMMVDWLMGHGIKSRAEIKDKEAQMDSRAEIDGLESTLKSSHKRSTPRRPDASQDQYKYRPLSNIRASRCMRTRSSSNLIVESSTTPKHHNHRRSKQRVEPFSLEETSVVTMVDQRTMAELLQAPIEGYGDAIVIPAILAENFELKHGLLNLVTSKQFYGFEKEDPHAHIRWFNKITSTIKYKEVPNSSIKLMKYACFANCVVQERISKKRTKNEAKTTKPDTKWKSMVKTKSRQSLSVKKSTKVNPDKSKVKKLSSFIGCKDPFSNSGTTAASITKGQD